MKDYYKEFSLDSKKSAEELQDELFKQRKKWMQRQNASSAEKQQEAKEKVKLIDEAQEVFATASSKKAYDDKLKSESAPKPSSTTTTSTSTSSGSQKSGSTSSYNSASSSKGSSSYSSASGSKSSTSYSSTSSSKSSTSYSSASSSKSSTSYNSTSSSNSSSSYKPAKKKRGGFKRLIFIILLLAIAYYKKDFLMNLYSNVTATMPSDAAEWNGHYYKVYDNADSWADARRKCEKKGGHLVTITSAEENEFVYSYMVQEGYTQSYIGLYNSSYSAYPIWTWITDEPVEYTNWGEGEPNNSNGGKEYYCDFYNRAWNDCLPASTTQYICEWDSAEKAELDYDYIEYEGHVYKVFSDADGWTDAKERAEKKGGYLACIGTPAENAALLKLIRRSGVDGAYFGLYNTGHNENGFTYGWVSGEELTFTDWAPNQPDNWNNVELYGGFWEEGGQWNDFAQDARETYIVEWNSKDDVK